MRKVSFVSAVTGLLLVLMLSSAVAAEVGVSVVSTDHEKSLIRAWYRDNSPGESGKNNGKGKPGKALPPGIAKNLERGKPLPPGIAKQVLPSDLVGLLPPVRKGYERVTIDGKVLLVEIVTQVIHDVLEDLILH